MSERRAPRRRAGRGALALAFAAVATAGAVGLVARRAAAQDADAAEPTGTVDVRNTDVEGALRLIADVFDLSVASGRLPPTRVTLRLRDVTADEALAAVASAAGVQAERRGRVIHVVPPPAAPAPPEAPDRPAIARRVLIGPFPDDVWRAFERLDETGLLAHRLGKRLVVLEGPRDDVESAVAALQRLLGPGAGGIVGAPTEEGAAGPVIVQEYLHGPFSERVEACLADLATTAALRITRASGRLVVIEGGQETVARAVAAVARLRAEERAATLTERVFRLGFGDGEATLAAVQPLLAEDERVSYDAVGHELAVTAHPPTLARIEELVEQRDATPPQFEIEARVYEVSKDDLERFGTEWSLRFGVRGGAFPTTFPKQGLADSHAFFPSPLELTDLSTIVRVVNQLGAVQGGTLFDPGFIFGRVDASQVAAFVDILARQTDLRAIATPRVNALQNRAARVEIVDTIRVPTFSRNLDANVEFVTRLDEVDVGTTLEVRPRLGEKGSIALLVRPEVSEVVGTADGFPIISHRRTETEVILDPNETLVIAGLIRKREVDRVRKLPFLGDIPGLGWLFRFEDTEESETELIVFLTPRRLPTPEERRRLLLVNDRWVPREAADALAVARERLRSEDEHDRRAAVIALERLDGALLAHDLDVTKDVDGAATDESLAVRQAAALFYLRRRPAVAFTKIEAIPENRQVVPALLGEPLAPHVRAGLAEWLATAGVGRGEINGALTRAIEVRDETRIARLLEALERLDADGALVRARRLLADDSFGPGVAACAIAVAAEHGDGGDAARLRDLALAGRLEDRVRSLAGIVRLTGPIDAARLLRGAEDRNGPLLERRLAAAARAALEGTADGREPALAWSGPVLPVQIGGRGEAAERVAEAIALLERDAPDYAHFVHHGLAWIVLDDSKTTRLDPKTHTLHLARTDAPPERLAHRLVHHARAVFDARIHGHAAAGGRAIAQGVREEVRALARMANATEPTEELDRAVARVLAEVVPEEATR